MLFAVFFPETSGVMGPDPFCAFYKEWQTNQSEGDNTPKDAADAAQNPLYNFLGNAKYNVQNVSISFHVLWIINYAIFN